MEISSGVLRKFNAGQYPTFNERYNEKMGLPNRNEYRFLSDSAWHTFGVLKGQLTRTHIRKYIESTLPSERWWVKLEVIEADARV